jgi:hypothetical protein
VKRLQELKAFRELVAQIDFRWSKQIADAFPIPNRKTTRRSIDVLIRITFELGG